ncbi:MAG: exo-alpha-sialidase [Clostridiaceae bacterium]|nr:exo-alpha-sialidase [Clostridiaceae bacterium]
MYRISDDNGESFEEEQELIPGDRGGRGPVKNKPVRLKNGRILAPASTEQGIWKAFADISDDEGKSWRKSKEVFIDHLCFHDGERAAKKKPATYL